jgi:hypothetical protein
LQFPFSLFYFFSCFFLCWTWPSFFSSDRRVNSNEAYWCVSDVDLRHLESQQHLILSHHQLDRSLSQMNHEQQSHHLNRNPHRLSLANLHFRQIDLSSKTAHPPQALYPLKHSYEDL